MFRRLLLLFLVSALTTTAVLDRAFGAGSSVDFKLNGVLISPTSRSALVNGKIARAGDRVDGIEILAIEEGAVRVLTGAQEYTVLVGSSAWLEPTAARSARTVRQPVSPTRQVNRGDTLSSIAEDYAGDGVSLNQVMVALFRANPRAFDGNINRLRAGAVLAIPDRHEVRRYIPNTATAEVMHHTESWRADRTQRVRVATAPAELERSPVGQVTAADQGEYGPVRYGETLSEIAVRVSGDGVSMNEMMLALFEANPHAFGDSIDLLHEGAVLRIPAVAETRQYETFTARVL